MYVHMYGYVCVYLRSIRSITGHIATHALMPYAFMPALWLMSGSPSPLHSSTCTRCCCCSSFLFFFFFLFLFFVFMLLCFESVSYKCAAFLTIGHIVLPLINLFSHSRFTDVVIVFIFAIFVKHVCSCLWLRFVHLLASHGHVQTCMC